MEEDGRVRVILVEQDGRALDGHQRVAVLHEAGHHHRVYRLAGRENIGEAGEEVALVVVLDGFREGDGVGRVLPEVLLEPEDDGLALDAVFRGLRKGRGEDDPVDVLDLDVFVESEDEAGLVDRDASAHHRGDDLRDEGRNRVLAAAGRGFRRIGAAVGEQQRQQDEGDRQEREIS